MKRKLIAALVLCLCLGFTTSAQDFNFGVKGGVAANWMPGTVIDGLDRPTTNVGFYGGLIGDLNFDGSFFLRLEALYARKGVSTNSDITGKYSRNISYLQIPVLAGFKLADESFRVMFGPEFGFCVGEKINIGNQYGIDPTSYGKSAPFNLALALQATYMIVGNLGVDIKFDYGLTKTLKETFSSDKGRNMSVQLGLCVLFGD